MGERVLDGDREGACGGDGDDGSGDDLLGAVYDELRILAAQRMANERPDQTLQATALVHEAWLRLNGGSNPGKWANRAHFFAAAAESMRRILIDNARRKHAVKRGGGEAVRVPLTENLAAPQSADENLLLRVHEALDELERVEPRAAGLVKLRFFVGMSVEEAALALGVNPRTATRDWRFARAWLADALGGEAV